MMHFEDVRFRASLAVFITLASVTHFIAWLVAHGANTHILPFLVTLFVYSWFSTFGTSMSRARRATFDEHNLLVTYQPRALTHGHLFTPEPPTPVPIGSSAGQPIDNDGGCTKSEFRAARDAHYRDEFKMLRHPSENMHGGCGGGAPRPDDAPISMRIEFEEPSGSTRSSSDNSTSSSPCTTPSDSSKMGTPR